MIEIAMVCAMNVPAAKASSIRVVNQVNTISKATKVTLFSFNSNLQDSIKTINKSDNINHLQTKSELVYNSLHEYYSLRKRLIPIFQIIWLLSKEIKNSKFNLIHCHTIEGLLISIIAKVLSNSKIPIVCDMHGPFIPEILNIWPKSNNLVSKFFLTFFEKFVYTFVDSFIVTSRGLKEYIENRLILNQSVHIFHDYVVLSEIPNRVKKSSQKKVNNNLVYVGTLKDYQGIDILLRALLILKSKYNKIFNLIIVGDRGLGKDFYVKRTDELGISNQVLFTGMVKHSQIWEYLYNADVVISPRLRNKITESGFVSQIPEYLAAGCVILATDISECDKMLFNCGYLVEPNSEDALVNGIMECFADHKNWQEISINARLNATKWSWEKHVDRLLELYRANL